MSTSRRHHYIPQFLIRNFSDSDGRVFALDKQSGSINSRSPKSIFFEWDRNTLESDAHESDVLEQIYSSIDDYLSKPIVALLKSKELTPESVMNLWYFITGLRWRIPNNDDEFNRLNDKISYQELPFEIRLKGGTTQEVEQDAINHLMNTPIFKASLRHILPMLSVYEGNHISEEKLLDVYNNSALYSSSSGNFVLGDVPVIEGDSKNPHLLGNIIFPLSNSDLFISSHSGRTPINPGIFHLNMNLAVIHQSRRFIVSNDRKHLSNLYTIYKQIEEVGKADEIPIHIFKYLQ